MAYLVRITPRARRDLDLLFKDIHTEDSEAALKWYRGLREALLTLEELPNRCP
jgi:toxin ParE1/3/4